MDGLTSLSFHFNHTFEHSDKQISLETLGKFFRSRKQIDDDAGQEKRHEANYDGDAHSEQFEINILAILNDFRQSAITFG